MLIVIANALSWLVKLLDWMLFSVWAEVEQSKHGLGYNSLKTSFVPLISFPFIAISMIWLIPKLKKGNRTAWISWTSLIFFIAMIAVSLLIFIREMENLTFCFAIILGAVKDGCYILWMSQWNTLVTKMFPKRVLGEIYAYSYFGGHLFLVIGSQLFPRLLTYLLGPSGLGEILGNLKIPFFFLLLGIPMLIVIPMSERMHTIVKKEEQVEI